MSLPVKFIGQMATGSKVTLKASDATGFYLLFESEIALTDPMESDYAYIIPTQQDDLYLKYDNPHTIIEIVENGLCYSFVVEDVKLVRRNGVLYHKVHSTRPRSGENRRSCVRVPFVHEAQVQINNKFKSGQILNLSYNGIGVVVNEVLETMPTHCLVTFQHLGGYLKFMAFPVRMQVEDERTILGCKLAREYNEVRNIINTIQTQDLLTRPGNYR